VVSRHPILAVTRLLGVVVACACLTVACETGATDDVQDIFDSSVAFEDLGDFQLDIDSGNSGWDYPDHDNADGSITRVIWLAENEAVAFKSLCANCPAVVEKRVVVADGPKLPKQVVRRSSDGMINANFTGKTPLESLTLTGDRASIDEVTDLIVSVQKSIAQLDIGIRVVEVSETDTFSFGIDTQWSSVEDDPSSPTRTFFNTAGTLLGLPEIPGRGGSFNPGSTTPLLIDLGTITRGIQVDFLIRALKLFSRSDLLSAPHIAVLDGHSASITAGEEIPFLTPNFNNTGLTNVSTTFKSVGIKLFVTPKVVGRDLIRINLTTAVEAVTGENTFESNGVTVSNPIITIREATTTMDVNDGDTAIIGGLLTRSKFNNENRVPVLGEIPVVNVLFSSRSKNTVQSNLIFFITPKIMDPSEGRRRMITPVVPTPSGEDEEK
jgi:type II secretory pathway component GspD/PulD (secretin)